MLGIEYLFYARYSNEVVEEHFRRIKGAGIDVVWIFCDDLDDFGRVLGIAKRVGLSVIPTLTTIGPEPERFLQAHPDERMVVLDESGRATAARAPAEPTATIPEQALGPCFNSPAYQKAYADFVESFFRRYGDEPAFYRYNGRPVVEFTREAWYRTGHRELGICTRPSCYCRHCVEKYRAALQGRFTDVAHLNAAMGTGFGSWDDVVPPRDPARRAFWKDWLDFHAEIIPQFLAAGIKAARSVRPEIMATHEINDWYPVWWDSVFTGNDYYRMARELDICFEDMYPLEHHHVHAIYLYEYTKDVARAAGWFSKPVWANAQALVGWIDFYPPPVGWEIEQVYSAVAHGASGIAWWHDFHGPDPADRPDIRRYGDLPDRLLEATREANAEFKGLLASTAGFELKRSQIATLYSWTTMELQMDDVHPYDTLQAYSALVRSNYPVDVLSEEQVAAGLLVTRGYRVLFVLGCSALPEPVRDAIVEFVKNGGALVQDYSGAANEPYTSLFNDRVEGPGTAGPSYIMINDLLVRRGVSYTVRARAEALRPGKGDRVLAVYEDGRPAVITFRVGKGNVFRFGSMIGIDYGGWQPGVFEYKEPRFLTYISHQEDLRKLIDTIVRRSGVVPPAETDNPDVEVAVLQKGDEFKLLVINHRDEGVRTNIRVPVVGDAYAVVDVRANKELHAEMLDGHLSFEVDLGRLDGRELRIVPAT